MTLYAAASRGSAGQVHGLDVCTQNRAPELVFYAVHAHLSHAPEIGVYSLHRGCNHFDRQCSKAIHTPTAALETVR